MDNDLITTWTRLVEFETKEPYLCTGCQELVGDHIWVGVDKSETGLYCRRCAENYAHSNMQINEQIYTGCHG